MKRVGIAAAFSARSKCRSISLPTRPHPSTREIEEELNKLRPWQHPPPSSTEAEKMIQGLLGLGKLYDCVTRFLNLSSTRKTLSQCRDMEWLDRLLQSSINHLDACVRIEEAISSMKGSVRELQSVLRRSRAAVFNVESNVNDYLCFRKRMKKELARSLATLKQKDDVFEAPTLFHPDDSLHAITSVLSEATAISNSMFCAIISFLSSPVSKSKLHKWSLVSRFIRKGVLVCEDCREGMGANELELVDVEITRLLEFNSSKDIESERIESATLRLKALSTGIEGIESGLECLFRQLIHTRVCLLNIFSC